MGENQNEGVLVPTYGGYSDCITVLEREHRIPSLLQIIEVIDSQFGVNPACDADMLMENVVRVNCRPLTVVSGYAHLLAAEHMRDQGFDKTSINREIDKAEALLHHAHLGGNHPWLPRAQSLKRRLNWREYAGLGLAIAKLLAVIVVSGIVYHILNTSDIDFFG
jgi:hypothetical protein